MKQDRTQIFKGMRMEGEPGPTAPPPFSRRDTITKGAFLISDAGGPVIAAGLASRMDNLRKRIEEVAAIIRKSHA